MIASNRYIEDYAKQVKQWQNDLSTDATIDNIAYSYINTKERTIHTMPSHYAWHLSYWDNQLDLQIGERLKPGMHYWNNINNDHQHVLNQAFHHIRKIDICVSNETSFDLFSVSYLGQLTLHDYAELQRFMPFISYQARQIRKKLNDKVLLPLRADNVISAFQYDAHNDSLHHDYHGKLQFGHLTLTVLEWRTINAMLKMQAAKEIARNMKCSEVMIRKRIHTIKTKCQCAHQPNSKLFQQLKKYGVTSSCLNDFII